MGSTLLREFAVRLRHDSGRVTFHTWASDRAVAVRMVLLAECAPESAIEWVRYRPTCDWCDQPATRKDDGETPLCKAHARNEFGPDWKRCTRLMGITSFETA